MKLFIWRNVSKLTDREHDGGGLVVVTVDLAGARALIQKKDCEAITSDPDQIYDIVGDNVFERAWSFPNAGCC